ncbi:hypothetical protein Sfum_1443 [Syntrophobacter fumaroxidans MPOB]|uniref:Uncharacterized protein n=1 Tax=Syntrophobacter fumaroxidans (strain DSM 10017 / MPOB) TaxID=335543 RepID=A0LI82_SYNFM|nr:hypothetical protein Sfum_1443 [Syntrophobacter fumaroxidans MPOB]
MAPIFVGAPLFHADFQPRNLTKTKKAEGTRPLCLCLALSCGYVLNDQACIYRQPNAITEMDRWSSTTNSLTISAIQRTGEPVADIIHNFGRSDEFDRDDLARLCRSIARVCCVDIHDPIESAACPASGVQSSILPEGVRQAGGKRKMFPLLHRPRNDQSFLQKARNNS